MGHVYYDLKTKEEPRNLKVNIYAISLPVKYVH